MVIAVSLGIKWKVIIERKGDGSYDIKGYMKRCEAVQERDPAAENALEVLLLYQGVHALIWHRFAHWFYKHKMFFAARLISQIARFSLIGDPSGHSWATGSLIDHGCGVVIGETTVVGDNCTIYRGLLWEASANKRNAIHSGGQRDRRGWSQDLGSFEVGRQLYHRGQRRTLKAASG